MSFFRTVDDLDIIRTHVRELEALELDEAEKILEIYRRVRNQLRENLRRFTIVERRVDPERLDGTRAMFTTQRLRSSFVQIERAIEAFGGEFLERIEGEWVRGALLSVEHLEAQINRLSQVFLGAVQPINLPGLRVAAEQKNFLVNNYGASIRRWSEQTRFTIAMELQDAVARGDTHDQVITRMINYWEAKEWQLRRIVRTEMHSIYNLSKLPAMRAATEVVPDLKKALWHPIDHRTAEDSLYLKELNPILPIDEPFRYSWQSGPGRKVYHREFMSPPDRPNDRAILIPYSESWASP